MLAAVCSLAAVGVLAVPAQAITYYQQSLGFSVNLPEGVAVDGSGTCSPPTPPTTGWWSCRAGGSQTILRFTGLNGPSGAAVDGSGDVFATDSRNNRVVELPAGGSQTILPFTGLNGPSGVAVDGSGDVFVTDYANNRVVELPAGGTQVTLPFTGLVPIQGVRGRRVGVMGRVGRGGLR